MKQVSSLVFIALIALAGCNKSAPTAAAGPAATVTLKDGSTFSGSVTKSDTSTITLQSASGESRTYPMTQVATVQYGDQPAGSSAPLASQSPPPNPAPPPPVQSAPIQPAPVQPAPMPQEPQRTVAARPAPRVDEFRTIPAGTTLQIRNNESISSETASPGQTYTAVVAESVLDADGRVAIPRGSNATLVVREANGQGKLQGRSELVLDVGSVSVGGRTYRLETADLVERGKEGVGTNKRTAMFAGGGTALGGIIGALAGGGKGAAVGALSGAAAGTATQAVTRGHALRVPAETLLNFKLEAPVHVREAR
jgi:hypothetical protein